MNSDQPLGLPQGSVRAILALLVIIFSGIYFVLYNVFPDQLLVLDTMVLTWYFVSRGNADVIQATVVAQAQQEALPEPYIGRDV
jgi:hypothetical protein